LSVVGKKTTTKYSIYFLHNILFVQSKYVRYTCINTHHQTITANNNRSYINFNSNKRQYFWEI